MTDPVSEAAWPPDFVALSATERETCSWHFLDAVHIALEAMKLAVELAGDAPRTTSLERPTLSATFDGWAAANLVVSEVFAKLYTQTRYAIDVIKARSQG